MIEKLLKDIGENRFIEDVIKLAEALKKSVY
jgi:hypothetical protein